MKEDHDQAKNILKALRYVSKNKGTKKLATCIEKHGIRTVGDIVNLIRKGEMKIAKHELMVLCKRKPNEEEIECEP